MPKKRETFTKQAQKVSAGGKKRAGFSILEVLMVSVIIGIVFAGLFSALGQGFYMIESARDLTTASEILLKELEDIRTRTWADLSTYPENGTFQPESGITDVFGDRYHCTRILTDRKADQKQLTLIVSWTDSREVVHSRQFFTYLTKEGLHDYTYRAF